jgi:hypothetical protein
VPPACPGGFGAVTGQAAIADAQAQVAAVWNANGGQTGQGFTNYQGAYYFYYAPAGGSPTLFCKYDGANFYVCGPNAS